MKLSEAIDRLEVGETVWVKATVDRINNEGKYIRVMPNASFVYLDGHDEISLAEPQAEKVEVPDYVAKFYDSNSDDLEDAITEQCIHGTDIAVEPKSDFDKWFFDECPNPIETLIRMKDGYIVEQPKRWVVKFGLPNDARYFRKFNGCHDLGYNYVGKKENAHVFTDQSKAEAVATLVDGSVEGV